MSWYRSLYWRIALGFVAFLAAMLVVQAVLFTWAVARSGRTLPGQSPIRFAETVAFDLATAMERDPAARRLALRQGPVRARHSSLLRRASERPGRHERHRSGVGRHPAAGPRAAGAPGRARRARSRRSAARPRSARPARSVRARRPPGWPGHLAAAGRRRTRGLSLRSSDSDLRARHGRGRRRRARRERRSASSSDASRPRSRWSRPAS